MIEILVGPPFPFTCKIKSKCGLLQHKKWKHNGRTNYLCQYKSRAHTSYLNFKDKFNKLHAILQKSWVPIETF
jgi:hypothetical protein